MYRVQRTYFKSVTFYLKFSILNLLQKKDSKKNKEKKRKIKGKKNEKKNFNCDFGNYDVCDPGGKCLC